MEKISSRLKKKIDAAGTDIKSMGLLITLHESRNWNETVRLIQEAGLQLDSTLQEIRVISGKAKPDAIRRLAKLPIVEIIEFDDQASAMK